MRGETCICAIKRKTKIISIHSPHARGDTTESTSADNAKFQSTPLMRGETRRRNTQNPYFLNFNPLPSCEGRLECSTSSSAVSEFQSTPLMRGETPRAGGKPQRTAISIHSPHARGDFRQGFLPDTAADFNPLPSCEGRHDLK